MAVTEKLEHYIASVRDRLRALALARGAAFLAAAACLVTIVAVAVMDRSGFAPAITIAGRLVLLASLTAVAWAFIIRPRRRIASEAPGTIESRAPAFGGRIETFAGMPPGDNPLRDLLAEDTLEVATTLPPEKLVEQKELRQAWVGAGIAGAVVLLLALAGPGNFAWGVRELWLGWAFPGLLPPQSIVVTPGDGGIRLGGNLRIEADLNGFTAENATMHASFDGADWQQVAMAGDNDAFEFIFYSVREPLDYYVTANNVRSPTYRVEVVDLPNVEKLVLTYRFPEWTGRDPETRDPGGDVRVIGETVVDVEIVADRPMTPGELVVDNAAIPMRVDGETAQASFTVQADGQYHVAARVGGERIRLTDDYFISVLEDGAPTIQFERPGRDWSASPVEEVTARIAAEDDIGIENVTLHFSVNGGDWQQVLLPQDGPGASAEHVFFLESLNTEVEDAPLVPGDLIAYYAIAEDRDNSTRTDMFFIDVQPFDRRYSQAQAGSPMGGAPGNDQDEISSRQREIIISTWNLIREQAGQSQGDDAYIVDNAALLARLQATLKEQVESLAFRSEARQLTTSDSDIAQFVEHLRNAADAMVPAAERLEALELEQALLPEQEALKHLLAAEAVFTDINIGMQTSSPGGGQAGRDLTEMFELEMDLEKNQYETGSRASAEPPPRQMEEAADELAELARRQEQLARNRQSQQTPLPAQRWQQEMLRRDVEELLERLERMAEATNQRSQGEAAGSGDTGSDTDASGEPDPMERGLDELRRRVDSALRAMNDADSALRGEAGSESLERSLEEARRQLEGARDRATEARQDALESSVADLATRADELYETQDDLDQRLQAAVRRVLLNEGDADEFDSGLSIAEEFAIANEKRELLADLERLQQEARSTAKELESDRPRAADTIGASMEMLEERQVEARLAVAAAYIEQGEGIYVASSESAVTEALRELRNDLQTAQDLVRRSGEGGAGAPRDQLRETLAGAQQLRRNLQRLADGDRPANAVTSGIQDDRMQRPEDAVEREAIGQGLEQQMEGLADDVSALLRDFSARGSAVPDADELRELAAGVDAAGFSGNPELLERESRLALELVEKLELALTQKARRDDDAIRVSAEDEVPEAYREVVADYYRRLGSGD